LSELFDFIRLDKKINMIYYNLKGVTKERFLNIKELKNI